MSQIVDEVREWHTSLVGAYMLWRFTSAYREFHKNGEAPVVLLHFVAGAILTHNEILPTLSLRRPTLQSFVRGFEERKQTDLLVGLQARILSRRQYTLDAIGVAVATGLLVWDAETARIYSREVQNTGARGPTLSGTLRRDGEKAAVLGKYFAQSDLPSIASFLQVVF